MNALILAAGLGTRLKPLTDTMPKAMVPVNGKPLLYHLIERLKSAGFVNLVVNVHHFSNQIIDYLAKEHNLCMNISISDETDKLLDTGGAIKKAAKLFPDDKPFLVHNVDIFHNIDLKTLYEKYAYLADAVLVVSNRNTSRYLLFDNNSNRLVGWINMKTGEVKTPYEAVRENPLNYNRLAFSGIHIFSHSLLREMDEWGDKFSIIDFYLSACRKFNIIGLNIHNLHLLDIGKLDTLSDAGNFLSNNTPTI